MEITIENNCDEQEFIQAVRINGLLEFNLRATNGKLRIPNQELLYVARNKNNEIVGGIYGVTYLSALEVEVLWVQKDYRGNGIATNLLYTMEEAARNIGCQLSHLSTYSFQALHFYQHNGYAICGKVDGFPDDIQLYFLKKQLS